MIVYITAFEGHFLGLTSVCNNDPESAVYECDVDDDVSDDDDRQFDDMMRNLGAVGLLEKYVTVTSYLPLITLRTGSSSLQIQNKNQSLTPRLRNYEKFPRVFS